MSALPTFVDTDGDQLDDFSCATMKTSVGTSRAFDKAQCCLEETLSLTLDVIKNRVNQCFEQSIKVCLV